MNALEKRTALTLSVLFFIRMTAIFMLLPVLSLYVDKLSAATPFLIGLALGIYGLSQAFFQIPMGRASDRFGRHGVIVAGLVLFTLGALIAAAAESIWPLLIGRAVQGTGAVSGATLALAADLSRDHQRTKIMAFIGVSIGLAFSLAFVIGPLVNAWSGLSGVFLSAAVLSVFAIGFVLIAVPRAQHQVKTASAPPLLDLLAADLRALYLGVFVLHLLLAASFIAIPVALAASDIVSDANYHHVYLPVLILSMVLVAPLIMLSARRGLAGRLLLGAIIVLVAAELMLASAWHQAWIFCAGLTLFFVGFNFVEASLPGIISRLAPGAGKGGALGAYATFQFLGMFAGGIIGGAIADIASYRAIPFACATIALLWLAISLQQRQLFEPTAPRNIGADTPK